jgi:hypothetical protein
VSGILAFPSRARRTRPIEGLPSIAMVAGIAGALALVTIVAGWRGSDLPAQIFRSDLVRRNGFVIWNSQWFGGHAVLGYSVIAPPLGAVTGPLALGAMSGVVSAVMFERILRFTFGRAAWIGAVWFALGTVINLMVGRTTFALGLALGIAAVYMQQRWHPVVAGICAALCSLASPLAGCFLALVAAAWIVGQRERRLATTTMFAAAVVPLAATVMLFPSKGVEPYETWALIWDLCLAGVVAAVGFRFRVLRWAAAFFAVAAVGSYLIPTAVGGNISRFGQYVAGPVIACALWSALPWRLLLGALSIPLVIWQFYPAIDTVVFARTDPSTHAAYYAPLLDYFERQDGPIGRVEIPSTFRHWEAAYAAPHVPLARGWERQLDIAFNPIFYEEPLTPQTYREWLHDNGVAYVALPDAQLDDSSLAERDLLLAGLPFLNEVWRSAHWRVWRVTGFTGLVDGPATLTELSPERVTLDVAQAGDILLRIRGNRMWTLRVDGNEPDAACATQTEDGWTVLRNVPPGTVRLTQSLRGSSCSNKP